MDWREFYYLIVLVVMVLIIFGMGVIIVIQDKKIRRLEKFLEILDDIDSCGDNTEWRDI